MAKHTPLDMDTVGGAFYMHLFHAVKEIEAKKKGNSLVPAIVFFGTGFTALAAMIAFNL